MAIYEVFSHSEVRRYKAHVCSKATLVQLLCIPITFIVPVIIAYVTQGLWLHIDTFTEQPAIIFKHKLLLILETSNSYISWSTYQQFNTLHSDYLRTPVIMSREVDINNDGKLDYLDFTLEMPLLDTEDVSGIKLLLFFDYSLLKYSQLQMESMAYFHYVSASVGGALNTVGDLKLKQKQPLFHSGLDIRYNSSIINETSIYAEDYELANIFQQYELRNITTHYVFDYPTWIAGRGAGQPFTIKARVTYPTEYQILYTPGFWQEIENGWIHYLSILLITLFVFDRIKIFIYQNQLVATIVDRPLKAKTS